MNRKKRKISVFTIFLFILGLVMYLGGLFLLFSSGISKTSLSNIFFSNIVMTTEILNKIKIIGSILFLLGFILFMIAVILLYKNDKIQENAVNLIIEGKADVITLIIMTYVLIFMIVICLLYNELIGALLFGITIIIQSVVNTILIKYYSKSYKRK
ncbi:MAG TPA: hypothetical protein IAC02_08490 [Candidatus Coprovivens excrementavium]|nr:hypothetical protein [Candidatus Coprovivens excrementavium]